MLRDARLTKTENKAVLACLVLILLLTSLLSMALVSPAKAQDSTGSTVGLWHLDEILPDGYREITPDATGQNPGMLVHAPEYPVLVEGKFDKAMEFDGSNGVYVPIRFLVGFPLLPSPYTCPFPQAWTYRKRSRLKLG